jgi:formylglycine-generating enzyme required for sulfatase activity
VKIEEALKDVRREVMEKTSKAQVPWESSSLTGDFWFVPPEGTSAERPEAPAASSPAPPPPVAFGHLQVNVNVPESKVYVNGTYRGDASPGAPLNLQNVGTGEVEVRVESGGRRESKRVTLVANQWTQAVLELPVIPPTPVPPVVTPSAGPIRPSVSQAAPGGAGAGTGEMVNVPAGEFLMGSPSGEGDNDEHPQHTVYLDAYYIDKYEVTNAQYQAFVRATGHKEPYRSEDWAQPYNWTNGMYPSDKADHPVVLVDWNDADAYCRWAGKRLPTEAEWEKAARGTDGRKYPWGNWGPSSGLLNFNTNVGKTSAVGSYPSGASPYGALDMAGNVWEWCADWYDANYYGNSLKSNPTGANTRSYRVLRGGSWGTYPSTVPAANRGWSAPTLGSYLFGFRCSRTP